MTQVRLQEIKAEIFKILERHKQNPAQISWDKLNVEVLDLLTLSGELIKEVESLNSLAYSSAYGQR